MDNSTKDNHSQEEAFIQELPLILAGPILQHTDAESVTVWIALKQSCEVHLTVYETIAQGETLGSAVFEGVRSTVALGKFLHIVAVTARSMHGQALSCDRLYAYDLKLTPQDQAPLSLEQAVCSSLFPVVSLSYFAHQKPTFALPPSRLQDLRIVHGSCRKAHGNCFDALPMLDCLLEAAANQPQCRPHQLFLTGDQVYGDDVADPFLWAATWIGDALLGWEEKLPIGRREPDEVDYYTPKELPYGKRAKVATAGAGFTAGLRNKRAKVTSHLLSLSEYYASYLLAWSPVCWLKSLPQGREVLHDRKAIKAWDAEVRDMQQFVHTLWKVRRALANIPVYTIFDDHDVSDDWNLNRAWCLRVLGRPLGRRAVQNALLAYAVFQAWGNTPQQFTTGRSGAKLLAAAQAWSASQGTDTQAYAAIARYVGMPASDPATGLPTFTQDDSVFVLDRDPAALTWHFTVQSPIHEVIVLDTRTWRGYPVGEKAIAPPMLLSPQAFERQLDEPLQRSIAAQSDSSKMTFVIAPTNVFSLQLIDWIHHWQLRRNKVFSTDVGDSWNLEKTALAKLLTTFFAHRQQLIVLSGDIHYSTAVRLSFAPLTSSQLPSVLVQLTSSAIKNEEPTTEVLHTRLKRWLLPEPTRRWVGWNHPTDMVEISATGPWRDRDFSHPPDWLCWLEWVPRQPAQLAAFGKNIEWLKSSSFQANSAKWQWLQPFLVWKWRWFQEGREIVGLNNLALVQCQPSDTGSAVQVIQDVYWVSPWQPTQIVYSRFATPLTPK